MEIVKEMKVPVEYLYDTMMASVLADIETHTGTKMTEGQLDGFQYTKSFSKNAKATIRIEECVRNKAYRYRTTNSLNEYSVSYELNAISHDTCELRYKEEMKSFGFLQSMNDMLIGLVWSPMKKKRFREMLKSIEASFTNGNPKVG